MSRNFSRPAAFSKAAEEMNSGGKRSGEENIRSVLRRSTMKRTFFSILVIVALAWPIVATAQGRGGRGGQGARASQQNRMGSPGMGQMGGDQIRQRDRLRDGTGANCPGCPSASTATQRGTRTQTQTQSRSQKQNQVQTRSENQIQNQNQVQTQGGTQNQVRTQQQQQTQQQAEKNLPQ
jgi:hypothetical protein